MRKRVPGVGLLAIALACEAVAAQTPELGRPRGGADATPHATPPFAPPGPPPLLPLAEPPRPAGPEERSTAGRFVREVRVLEERPGRDEDAVPPPGWRPMVEALSGLRLEHAPGEPLNAAWVRRQFALNLPEGAGAGRAVALVQLINRAFLSASFVNSGLLVAPDGAPDILTLRLIHGRLAPPAPGAPALDINFVDGQALGLDAAYVRDRMPSASSRPLSTAAIERDFRLLTEDPALRTVHAQLRPGVNPGEASLLLTVLPQERAQLYLTGGNSRSPTVGGDRLGVGGLLRNAIAGGDLLSAETGLTRGVIDASVAYAAPLVGSATSLNLRASYNEAAVVDAPLVPLDIETRDLAGQVTLMHQLLRAPLTPAAEGLWLPSRALSAGIGLGHRRQNSFLMGQPFSFAPGSAGGRAEYTALRLIGDYVERNVDQVVAASVTGTIGLGGTRSELPTVISPRRNFLALLVQLNYARRLNGAGLELRARLTGQLANSVLYSGERLGIGGESSVRGYRETLLLADQGLVGSLELALPISLSGGNGARRAFDWGAFSIGGFLDGAYADNVEGTEPEPELIGAAGVSLSWQPSEAVALRLSYGHALVGVDPTGSRSLQDDGVHVRFTVYPLRLIRGR